MLSLNVFAKKGIVKVSQVVKHIRKIRSIYKFHDKLRKYITKLHYMINVSIFI